MAEEKIDPKVEGARIVNKYLSELGWAKEYKRSVARQLIPAIEKDPKLEDGDKMEEKAEENFGNEVDRWRSENTDEAREVLNAILKKIGKRRDLGFFGQRMIKRLKEELSGWV